MVMQRRALAALVTPAVAETTLQLAVAAEVVGLVGVVAVAALAAEVALAAVVALAVAP